MDCPRDQFLTRAGFALDQDRGVQSRDRLNQLEDLLHRTAAADDIVESVLFLQLAPQVLVLKTQLPLTQSFTDPQRELDQLERFGQVVVGALLDGLDGRLDGCVAGNHQADRLRVLGESLVEEFDAVPPRQHEIGDEYVVGDLGQFFGRFLGRARRINLESIQRQNFDYGLPKLRFVINHKYLNIRYFHNNNASCVKNLNRL